MFTRFYLAILLAALAGVLFLSPSRAADAAPDAKDVQALVDKAVAFLKTRQNQDGGFSPEIGGPGVTALVVAGLIHQGYGPNEPVVAKALGYLEKAVQKDGGIYQKRLANYTTSVALLALNDANTKGKYDTIIKNAAKFLKTLQYDDSLVEEKDLKFGGVGYDGKGRPDLSNTQLWADALLSAGVSKDDPAIKRMLKFVSRCQNLPGETNDQPYAKKTSDDDKGGLVYNPVVDDKNKMATAQGGLRSAGAMTYAGLKTFLHAGVDKNDPRVKAATDWIRRHYTLDENPGMGTTGLYYYYHTFGKAMDALGEDPFLDKDGKKHEWRKDLFEALKKRQKKDGSWSSEMKDVFAEHNPDLATAYALLALAYCKPAKK